jgi:hypothetical protein
LDGISSARIYRLETVLGNEVELEVYGGGLLHHILETGASYTDIKEI